MLRPGGVIGIADWDRDSMLMHPEPPLLRRSLDWLAEQRRQQGGNPRAGRELARVLQQAGFAEPAMGVVAEGIALAPVARLTAERWATTFEAPATRAWIVAEGLATDAEVSDAVRTWRAWGREPGALWVVHWFHAVAFR